MRRPRGLRLALDLRLPLDAVTSTLIVYGGKGMGKTNLLSVVLEEMTKESLRWCSIDPIGVHWGLRHAADGKGDGVECLILGGVHGDIPIEPTAGEVVADLVADEDVNVIIDCSRDSTGKMWKVGERTRFITAFVTRLFEKQGSLIGGERRPPLFVALDEAARYVPQTIPHGNPDLAASLSAWEQLVEEGRNVGLGVGLFTQRSARLNKSVAELADTMIAFRTTGPNSINAIIDWLGEHVPKADQRTMVEQVRKLPVGTALVVSPGWLVYEGVVALRARETFDSSATPKPGQRAARVVGSGAVIDLEAYRMRMADTIASAEANDPKVLHRKIKELERTVRELELRPAELPEPERIEVPVITDAQVKEVRETYEGLVELAQSFTGMENAICDVANAVLSRLASVEIGQKTEGHRLPPPPPPFNPGGYRAGAKTPAEMKPPPASVSRPQVSAQPGDSSLGKAERSILTVLAQKQHAQTVTQIAMMTGYSSKGGGFRNALGALRTKGLVTGRDLIEVTEDGRAALGAYEELPTPGKQLVEWWKDRHLGKAEKAIIDILVENYPHPVGVGIIADFTGYASTGGGFRNALGRLRTLELASGRDPIALNPTLMEG